MGSAVLVLTGGWSAGVLLGALAPLPLLVVSVMAAAALAAVWLATAPALRLAALGVAACLLGHARVDLVPSPNVVEPLAPYAGPATVRGTIVEAPIQRGNRVEAVVEIERIGRPGETGAETTFNESRPRLLVRASFLRAGYGDQIETTGRIARPRTRPDYPLEQLLARRGIGWVMDVGGVRVVAPASASLTRLLADLRRGFESNTRAILPEPHASLVAGIVFGARVGLPPDLRAAMSATGTSHLTAVSGANVAMVAGALIVLLTALIGRAPACLLAMVGVWLYTILVGAPPSAIRAATMATFALAAQGLGRQPDAIGGLLLATAFLLGWDPGLGFDLGFQLSVVATAGLILLSPSIERWLAWLPRLVRGQFAIAVAAQLSTLPLIVGTFQRVSLVSLPANVLAAPTIVPIMGLGTAIAFLGQVPFLDALLGWSAWAVTSVLLFVIQTAAAVPGGMIAVGRAPAWLPVGWYLVLLCWAAAGSADVKALGGSPTVLKRLVLAGVATMAVLGVTGVPGSAREEGVQVTVFDAEPHAVFIRAPSGQTALLLTAPAGRGIVASVGHELDFPENVVDVEIAPGGLRTGVDLLDIGVAPSQPDNDPTPEDDVAAAGFEPATPAGARVPLEPGARVELGDGVAVLVLDRRLVREQPALDLAIFVDDLAILLPGPGATGDRWSAVAPEVTTVAVLPANAVTWARALPPRAWLAAVGDPPRTPADTPWRVPLLQHREYGAVRLSVRPGSVSVRADRCADGLDCEIALPAPVRQLLAPPVGRSEPAADDSLSDDDPPPVQSGRAGDGRRTTP